MSVSRTPPDQRSCQFLSLESYKAAAQEGWPEGRAISCQDMLHMPSFLSPAFILPFQLKKHWVIHPWPGYFLSVFTFGVRNFLKCFEDFFFSIRPTCVTSHWICLAQEAGRIVFRISKEMLVAWSDQQLLLTACWLQRSSHTVHLFQGHC